MKSSRLLLLLPVFLLLLLRLLHLIVGAWLYFPAVVCYGGGVVGVKGWVRRLDGAGGYGWR